MSSSDARSSVIAAAMRRSQAERAVMDVDLSAIVHNVTVIRKLCPGAKVMAVLKGDAYGVGADAVAAALQRAGVEGFAVDNVAEGIALRGSGIHRKIVILDGCVPENAALAVRHDLTPGIATVELLQAYSDAARQSGRPLPIWINYNCGFNRSGHRSHDAFREFVRAVRKVESLRPTALYSHLPAAHSDASGTRGQRAEYETALAIAREELGRHLESSLLASHGILNHDGTSGDDWVRPGIVLYGTACLEGEPLAGEVAERVAWLRPALTLRARLIHKLRFESSQHCGLGQKYAVMAGQTLGTVAIGFGSGLPVPSARWPACFAFAAQRYPLVTVGMDYCQIDLTHAPAPQLYDWVTLFGDPELGVPSLRDCATKLGMSPWVLMRQLRVLRRYIEHRAGDAASDENAA